MRLIDRLTPGDKDERDPDVRAIHAAMANAGDHPSVDSNAALFARLAEAHLWTLTVGTPPNLERLAAQARLSGHATMEFRAGRTSEGEAFIPAATTRQRLIRSGLGQPGDSMVRLPLRFLANAARHGGADALIVNPGTIPFGYIAGPALATFADGGIPDPASPDRRANVRPDHMGPIEAIEADSFPVGVLDAATAAVQAETELVAASLVVRSQGSGRMFVILAVASGDADRNALNDRMAGRLVDLIGGANYFAVEYVDQQDPRLTDSERAEVLIPR